MLLLSVEIGVGVEFHKQFQYIAAAEIDDRHSSCKAPRVGQCMAQEQGGQGSGGQGHGRLENAQVCTGVVLQKRLISHWNRMATKWEMEELTKYKTQNVSLQMHILWESLTERLMMRNLPK